MGPIDIKEEELEETEELMSLDIQLMKLAGLLICLMGLPVSIVLTVISTTDYAIFVVCCVVGTCWLAYDLVSDLLFRLRALRLELTDVREDLLDAHDREDELKAELSTFRPQISCSRSDNR